jgi:WD40 repeat protein
MGVVYEAQQTSLDRRVALKVLAVNAQLRPQLLERFRNEALAAARLHHTNIVEVHDVGEAGGHHYYVMQYIDGRSLAELEPSIEHHDAPSVAGLGAQAAEALAYAHEQGVLHRDIKPSNLLVDSQGQLWITDFGLAKMEGFDNLTASGDVAGTVRYLAPERLGGRADCRSDVFSLGLVMYELLAGRPAYDGADSAALLRQVHSASPPVLRRVAPGVPRDVETIVGKCLAPNPAHRYQSARALAEDCRRFLEDRPILARRTSPAERLLRWARRNKVVAASLFAVAVLLVVLTVGAILAADYFRRQEAVQRQLAGDLLLNLYAADMSTVRQALDVNHLERAKHLIARQQPPAAASKLRGWEWQYYWQQCQNQSRSTVYYRPETTLFAVRSLPGSDNVLVGGSSGIVRSGVGNDATHHQLPFEKIAEDLDVTRDGRHAIVVGRDAQNADVTVWELPTWREVARLDHAVPPVAASISADGPWAATLATDGVTRLWNWRTEQMVHEIPGAAGVEWKFDALAFAPDGKAVASGDADGHVRYIDVETGAVKWHVPAHNGGVAALAVSPDGNLLATSGGIADSTIRLWNAGDGERRGTLDGHASWISALRFSPDGRHVASASQDQTVRLWDPQAMQELAVLRGHVAVPLAVEFAPDGKTLLSAGADGRMRAWDTDPSSYRGGLRVLAGRMPLRRLIFSRDGTKLFVHRDGVVQMLDTSDWDTAESFEELGDANQALAISADERLLAAGDQRGRIKVWDMRADRLIADFAGHDSAVFDLAFANDGDELVSADRAGHFKRWARSDWAPRGEWLLPTTEPKSNWQIHPHVNVVTLLDANTGTASHFDLTTGTLRRVLDAQKSNLLGAGFSCDGRIFATVGSESVVRIWDAHSWQTFHLLKSHFAGIHSVAFSVDGRRLIVGSGGLEAVKIFDVATWRVLATLPANEPAFRVVALSPDGRSLLALSSADSLHVWQTPNIEQIDAETPGSK